MGNTDTTRTQHVSQMMYLGSCERKVHAAADVGDEQCLPRALRSQRRFVICTAQRRRA